MEVTRDKQETKADYLKRILEKGSFDAKILKAADRISNLTDINRSIFSDIKITHYLDETEEFAVPMAQQVNHDMVIGLTDLIRNRRAMLHREQ